MAHNTIYFENLHTGQMREAPVGFSWTVLFFGSLPPLFRGDWKWACLTLLCAMITLGLSHFVFIFIYNKIYIKELINDGFKVKSIKIGTISQLESILNVRLDSI